MTKNKKTIFALTGVFILTLILGACKTSDKVASSNLIQKRKYNNGFFVDMISKRHLTSKSENKLVETKITSVDTLENDKKETNIPSNSSDLIASTDKTVIIQDNNLTFSQSITLLDNDKKQIKSQCSSFGKKIFFKSLIKTFYSNSNKSYNDNPETNSWALSGFICSLAGLPFYIISTELFLLLGILGIIFSAIGLSKIRKDSSKWKGKGFAIAGLVLGIIEVAFFVTLFIVVLIIL